MLCVTHDRFVALALADEIVVLMNGKVMQTGPVSEVFTRPANAEVARFVGVETLQPGRITNVTEGLATVNVGNATLTALAPATASRDVFVCIRGEEVILQRDVRQRQQRAQSSFRPRFCPFAPKARLCAWNWTPAFRCSRWSRARPAPNLGCAKAKRSPRSSKRRPSILCRAEIVAKEISNARFIFCPTQRRDRLRLGRTRAVRRR